MNLLPDVFRSHIKAGLVGGLVYVARHKSDGIIGLAAWFGPGAELYTTPEQCEAGFNKLMADIAEKDPDMQIWWTQYFLPKYGEFAKEALGGPEYKRDGWTLSMIGVKREYQRRGIGTEFIMLVEEKVRNEVEESARHMTVDTETDEALSFYLKVGFVERGRIEIEAEKKFNGSFRQVCLTKDVAAATS
ncbi:uncharacterized protein FOMMEDRAFT_127812 [Fomitiporia mediterranea MF3/22]|uniref:uncharacterized protein n=1 Tax=Fomitiporia mediterranea (strain MF3/22) TaxID=694068 RepID=UPI000440790A|nr:uncharacterized protein FOMMEDRAFT_127812 [Fomitiporia mediterranea MF3/22]EJC99626.1 hypothetical protein FOMMEDRAFT_127812 [Fomitiporia mediterranea MF3/22]